MHSKRNDSLAAVLIDPHRLCSGSRNSPLRMLIKWGGAGNHTLILIKINRRTSTSKLVWDWKHFLFITKTENCVFQWYRKLMDWNWISFDVWRKRFHGAHSWWRVGGRERRARTLSDVLLIREFVLFLLHFGGANRFEIETVSYSISCRLLWGLDEIDESLKVVLANSWDLTFILGGFE